MVREVSHSSWIMPRVKISVNRSVQISHNGDSHKVRLRDDLSLHYSNYPSRAATAATSVILLTTSSLQFSSAASTKKLG